MDLFAADRLMRSSTLQREVERSIVVFVFDRLFERFPGQNCLGREWRCLNSVPDVADG
jgi:hypothetical protein